MLEYLRKNNKRILAVLGVFLMVAFIVPTVTKNTFRQGSDEVVAKIGDQPVRGHEYARARVEWEVLSREPVVGGQFPFAPFLLAQRLMAGNPFAQFGGMEQSLGQARSITRQIDAMQYLLLVREAQRMGIAPDAEQAERMVEAIAAQGMSVRVDPGLLARSIANWLSVMQAFDRVASAAKVSPAVATHVATQGDQKISLRLIQFTADQFRDQVPTPDPKQLDEFFNQYRNQEAGTGEFGFGYFFPNRVKLEYITVPFDAVRKTVTEEDTYQAFKRNPDQVPPAATQPSTRPATQPTAGATTRPAANAVATTAPTNRSLAQIFSEMDAVYKDQIRDNVARQHAVTIAKAVEQTMRSDYATFKTTLGEDGKITTTAPSSVGPAYAEYAYLEQVRNKIQRLPEARNVMPGTQHIDQFLSGKQLSQQAGIGEARLVDRNLSLPVYATQLARPFVDDAQRRVMEEEGLPPVALYEPSRVFADMTGNLYIFRLVAVSPAHAPASREAVSQKVLEDYLTAKGYEKAKEAAAKALEVARSQGLAEAAKGPKNREIVQTDLLSRSQNTLDKPKLPEGSVQQFMESAFKLLYERLKTGKDHPLGLVEAPRAGIVAVAQLNDATPAKAFESFDDYVMIFRRQLEMRRESEMLGQWLDPQSIESRMEYHATERVEQRRGPRRPAPETPPNPFTGA